MNPKASFADYRLAKVARIRSMLTDLRQAPDPESKMAAFRAFKDETDSSVEEKLTGNDLSLGQTPEEEILVPAGTRVTIPSGSLNGNLAISAMIDTGKTWLLKHLLRQLSNIGVKWLVFERKKSFRRLVDETNAIVFTPEELKHNLLRPPRGVSFRSHLMKICNIFAGTQMLTNVSEHLLYETILGNIADFQRENEGKYLDVFQVRILLAERIEKQKYKEQRMTNLLVGNADRWNGICAYLGEVYAELEGPEIYDMLQKNNVVIDCSELSNAMIAFLFFEFLSILTLSRLANELTVENAPLHLTAMDEFEDVISQVNMMGYSLLVDHWRRDRESNLGKIIVNHSADYHQRYDSQSITNTISSNTHFNVTGPMGNVDELKKIGRRLSFEDRHYEWLLGDEKRRFVLSSPHHPPVCFVADEVYFPRSFNEVEHDNRKSRVLSNYPSSPIPQARKDFALSQVFKKNFNMPKTMQQVRISAQNNLRTEGLRFLKLLKDYPLFSYAELRQKFNSVATCQKAKNYCLECDWVKEASVVTSGGRPSNFFHVAEEGRSILIVEGVLRANETLHPVKHITWVAKCVLILAQKITDKGFDTEFDKGDGLDLIVRSNKGETLYGFEFNYTVPVGKELKLIASTIGSFPKVNLVVVDFEEAKKNSFRMRAPEGKISAFRKELGTNFHDISDRVFLLTWEEALKWNP